MSGFKAGHRGNGLRWAIVFILLLSSSLAYAAADVVIESLWWSPAAPQPGQDIQFNVRVRNQGSDGTGADVGVGYFVDEGQGFRQVGWGMRGPMSAGEASESFTMIQAWKAPSTGNFRVLAIADDINRFREANEGNNGFEKTLTVAAAPIPADHWKGEYFNNTTLAGSPALVRDDGVGFLAFDWGLNGPATGIGADNFSVRWTRTVTLNDANYRLTVTADDGVRLWIDGQLKLDRWVDQAATTYTVEAYALAAGNHTLAMEFYEKGGQATARLSWEPILVPADHWKGEYFGNSMLGGNPALIRDDGAGFIAFNWGASSPASGIGQDNFSVRWTRTIDFSAGIYEFTVTTDDGVRLYVNDAAILDRWSDRGPTTDRVLVALAAGASTLKMDYYEHTGGAVAELSWRFVSPVIAADHWKGEYFDNRTLSGTPVLIRDDGTNPISFNWGTGSPATGLPADNFSVRWTREVSLTSGTYDFSLRSDDGSRLYIDGQLVMDYWLDQDGSITRTAQSNLAAGTHVIVLEYYERAGGASAQLAWLRRDESPVAPFSTGWEEGQINGAGSRILYAKDVVGHDNASGLPECVRQSQEKVFEGSYALKVTGTSLTPYAYAYSQVLDVKIPVVSGMHISYWIYHAQGTGQVAIDGHFTDGATLRDFNNNGYLKDQYGVRIHPSARRDPMNQWVYVEVDLSKAAGKTIDGIMVAFDSGQNGSPGQYLSYIDDFSIFVNNDPLPPPTGTSKLTIHTSFTGAESMRFIQDVQPAFIKILDNFGPAAEVKVRSPETKIVGRIYLSSQPQDGDPVKRADEWWSAVAGKILSHPEIDYWEGYNEPGIGSVAAMDWYSRHEKRRVEILASHGLKACIGNFSTGVPDVSNPAIWPAFYPAIDAARASGGILGLHEYSAPSMKDAYSGDEATGEGWLTGRYRKVYRQYLTPSGREIPLVITECGIDGGVLPPDPSRYNCGVGWKCYANAADYLNQLLWYDSVLQYDRYVLAATIFSLEIPDPQWNSFDIRGDVLNWLIEDLR